MVDNERLPVTDGTPSDDDRESGGSWRDHDRAGEPYREPDDSGPFDIEPEIPSPPDPTENDVDPELFRRFWALVVVFNVALLALSLGVMFAVFESNYTLGGQLVLGGLVVFGFGLYRYRTAKRYLAERSDDENETAVEADEPNG